MRVGVCGCAVGSLLRNAGIRLVQFAGGPESDQYDWVTDTDTVSGAEQATDFDQFMHVVQRSGAEAINSGLRRAASLGASWDELILNQATSVLQERGCVVLHRIPAIS
jgi:hypothetical protein